MRGMRRRFGGYRFSRWLQRAGDIFYQILLPLIIFQIIRTIIFPTKFDLILLGILVLLYLSRVMDWFSKSK